MRKLPLTKRLQVVLSCLPLEFHSKSWFSFPNSLVSSVEHFRSTGRGTKGCRGDGWIRLQQGPPHLGWRRVKPINWQARSISGVNTRSNEGSLSSQEGHDNKALKSTFCVHGVWPQTGHVATFCRIHVCSLFLILCSWDWVYWWFHLFPFNPRLILPSDHIFLRQCQSWLSIPFSWKWVLFILFSVHRPGAFFGVFAFPLFCNTWSIHTMPYSLNILCLIAMLKFFVSTI